MTEELLKKAVRNSTAAWFESHGRIYLKDRSLGPQKPKMNSLQAKYQAVIDRFEDLGLPIRIMGLKPRQKGSTTYITACIYTFLRRRAASAVLIGGQFSQVAEAWGMMQTYEKNDTFDGWENTGSINTKAGAWSNGSRLQGETAKDVLAAIGGTHQALHAFEVARWAKHGVANSAEVLANVTKSVPLIPGSIIVLESTAEGAAGDFYDRFVRAIDAEDFLSGKRMPGAGEYVRIFAAWFEFVDSALRLTPEQQREIERSLDSDPQYEGERELIETYGQTENGVTYLGDKVRDYNVWEQLAWRRYAIAEECKGSKEIFDRDYPRSWQTAFQQSGGKRFNQLGLAKIRARLVKARPQFGIIEQRDNRFSFRTTTEGESTVRIFEKPIPGCKYILPVDPMTGITQVGGVDPDFHGAIVMRAGYWDSRRQWQRMATAARIIPCRWDIDVLEEAVWRLSRLYGGKSGCMIAIEMNQDRGLTELLKKRGAQLYIREFFNQREQRLTKALGYQTNVRTRENLVEKLATVIRQTDMPGEGIDIWDEHALEQCENFVRKPNGRSEHADGWHDDDVLTLALGAELIGHATTYFPPSGAFFAAPMDDFSPAGGSGPSQYS